MPQIPRSTPQTEHHACTLMLALSVTVLILTFGCRQIHDSVELRFAPQALRLENLFENEHEAGRISGHPVTQEEARELLPDDILSLEESRQIAVRANPTFHTARARLQAAAARVAVALSRYYPSIVFSHTSTRTFHTPASRNRLNLAIQPAQPVPLDVDPQAPITTLLNALRRPLFDTDAPKGNRNPFGEHSSAITATWTVFDGFAREAAAAAARHLHQASNLALTDTKRLIVQSVDTAYYQVQLAEEQLRIARADEAFSREQFEETQKLRDAGRASTSDVDNFRVRVLAAQANVAEAGGLRETGRVVLAELLGLPDVTLPKTLSLTPLTDETEEEMTTPSPDPWIVHALNCRSDLRELEKILDSEKENVRAAKGLYLPNIAVSGSWGFDHSSTLRYSEEDQSSAGVLEFRWDLFTGGARYARVREAQSALAAAVAATIRLKLSVQAEVHIAIINLADAQQQIRLQRENLTTAIENRRLVQAAYIAGKETLTRLNESQRDVTNADASLALARIRVRQAWSDLYAAAGRNLYDSPADDGG